MRAAAGQALHDMRHLLGVVLGLCLLLLLLAGALVWRLSLGPIEVPQLARLIEERAIPPDGPLRLEVGSAAVMWAGWQEGRLMPVNLRLSRVRLQDREGTAHLDLPDTALSLSLPWLLRGEVAPRVLELRNPVLRIRRDAEGRIAFDMRREDEPAAEAAPEPPQAPGAAEALLREMMRPSTDDTPLGALTRLRILGGRLAVQDEALGLSWALQDPALDLRRMPGGGIAFQAGGRLEFGGQSVVLSAQGEVAGEPRVTRLRVTVPAVQPAVLAAAARGLVPLSALDAPATLQATVTLEEDFTPRSWQASLDAGAGWIDLGEGRRVPIAGLELAAEGRASRIEIPRATLRLAGEAAPGPQLTADARVRQEGGVWLAEASLSLDAVRFAELGRWWPEGIAGGARAWILPNVTSGTVRAGRWTFTGEAPAADPAAFRLTGLTGTAEATDATVHWLRPIPPAEQVVASAAFSLSEITIRVQGGRQAGGAVAVRDGTVKFLRPAEAGAQADIALGVAGPVPDVLAVIQHPRLKLFERRPLPLTEPDGLLEGRLNLTFPLLADLPVEQLRVRAQARLREVRLGDILMGRPLQGGQFELTVNNDGLRANGTATLAGINARVGAEMDFRPGPATQVVMRETVQARTDGATLAALDLGSEEVLRGPVSLDIRTERRRGGQGRVSVRAELRDATLELGPLGWSKSPGQNGGAEMALRLNGDRLEAIESFRVEAPALMLRGSAGFAAGARLEQVTISEAAVELSRFGAEARPPARQGGPWNVTLRGAVLDLRRLLAEDAATAPPAQADAAAEPRGASIAVNARFDRVLLGDPGRELGAVEGAVTVDGRGVVRQGRVIGQAGARGPFTATITPEGAGRSLNLTAEDAGALLRAFNVLREIEGGRLSVSARYASNLPGAPLAGTAEMSDFAIRDAPAFAKLLQAMTLYGLVEALSGPGLGFSRLIAPFTLTPDALELQDARAFSASLGLTAKGRLDRRRSRLDLEGTIVPAYMFNSLLGNIPIFGRLFSPEAGGGLFAATYRVRGALDDPQVNVNPLAALTPGFLRGLFGIGQSGGAKGDSAP